jgi:hypothetical protein
MCEPLALQSIRAVLMLWASRQSSNEIEVVQQNNRWLPPHCLREG